MWRERLGRIMLAVVGAMLIGLGLLGLLVPEAVLSSFDLTGGPRAYGEIRSSFGGRDVGMGIFFLAAAMTPALRRPGLLALLGLLGGLMLGWATSAIVDGLPDGLSWRFFVVEAVCTAIVLLTLTAPPQKR